MRLIPITVFTVLQCFFVYMFWFSWVYALMSAWIYFCLQPIIIDNTDENDLRANGRDTLCIDVDLNDLLRTFSDDTNNEVKSFTCSPYIETDSLVPILSRHKGDFSVLSLNIQSIDSKNDALLAVLSELNENNIKIDAICLQETWLSDDHDVAMFNIPGYRLISRCHGCSTHSGLIIFLADSYLIKSIHRGSQLWDGLFIEVTWESLCYKIVIGNLYRPPRFNNNNETIKQFWQELAPIISSISKNSSHVIIAGDFNID